jgi:hypothetical protein
MNSRWYYRARSRPLLFIICLYATGWEIIGGLDNDLFGNWGKRTRKDEGFFFPGAASRAARDISKLRSAGMRTATRTCPLECCGKDSRRGILPARGVNCGNDSFFLLLFKIPPVRAPHAMNLPTKFFQNALPCAVASTRN